MIQVTSDLKKINISELIQFINQNSKGNVFQTLEMYKVFHSTKNYQPLFFVAVNEHQEIVGSMLSCIIYDFSSFFRFLTARSVTMGTPLVSDVDEKEKVVCEILDFHSAIIKDKVVYSEIRNLRDISDYRKIYSSCGYFFSEHLNFLIDLRKSETELWSQS